MMEFQKDVRGVRRGACSKCNNCRGYDGSSSGGKKCKCLCPPAKHANLELPVCKKCGKNSPPDFDYCSPECRNKALKDKEIGVVETPDLNYSSPRVEMRRCRNEACSLYVYWDYKTEFQYCSPMCRDRDMLEGNHRELRQEIEWMEGVLLEQGKQLPSKKVLESSVDPLQGNKSNRPSPSSPSKGASTKSNAMDMENLVQVKNKVDVGASNPNVKNTERIGQDATIGAGFPFSAIRKDRNDQATKDNHKLIAYIKEPMKPHGMIVCQKPWYCESGTEMGVLITGIEVSNDLKSFKKMQDGQLRFFDVITEVDDKPVMNSSSDKLPQDKLDFLLLHQCQIKFTICRDSYSLRSTENIIAASKHCQSKPSHIIGIVNPIYYPNSQDIQDSWGMEVDADRVFKIHEPKASSSAYLCGLKDGDKYISSIASIHKQNEVKRQLRATNVLQLREIYDQFVGIYCDKLDLIVAVIRSSNS